jgi:aldehyde:ferredoxin oxidoreductase
MKCEIAYRSPILTTVIVSGIGGSHRVNVTHRGIDCSTCTGRCVHVVATERVLASKGQRP